MACVAAASMAAAARPASAQSPRFYEDDPLWVEPVTQAATSAAEFQPSIAFSYLANFLGGKGDPVFGQRAKNVNTVDEVPDGPFFVNRAGRLPLTPAMVARAGDTDDGPGDGPWTIVSGKLDGVTPGFTIHDARGRKWYLKFDPPGWPGMATGSEIVGSKLFWALGYHTAEYHILRLVRSRLSIAEGAKITPYHERTRPMRPDDVDRLLGRADRAPDGSYRAVASSAIPGRYVGRMRYQGARKDDPNDIVPHEHHRELRGVAVFDAWLDRVDVKRDQSIETVVTEGGRTFVRHYVIDWTSILGSAGIGPRERWQGYEEYVEGPGQIALHAVTFGLLIPKWRRLPFYEAPAIGRIPLAESSWNPEKWEPMVSNAAFRHARADDKFWAAYKMTFVTEDMVRAAVAAAQFSDSVAAGHLVDFIMSRRGRILSTYLPAINPIVDPALSRDGHLAFRNAAVDFAAAAPPRGYRATWSSYDNATGIATPIGVTEAAGTLIEAPALPATRFLKVEVSCVGAQRASWEVPVTLYFRQRDGSWELVGLQRM